MAAIGSLYPTLTDVVKRTDPDESISQVAELLNKTNPILQDIAFKEGNLATGHRYTGRTALPPVGWRKFNAGVAAGKSGTEQYDETCGMLEGFSIIDEALANLNGNAAAFRADEDSAFMTALNIEVATGLFYHDTSTNPEKFLGLSPRLGATSGNAAAAQIIKADATASGADQTSIWLVGWSPQTVFGIFPKGSKGGLSSTDLGRQLITDGSGNRYTAWVTKYSWQLGLCVRDWRYIVRICNIDTSAWKADLSAGADLVLSMLDAIAALFDLNSVQPVFYMNRACYSMLNKQLAKKATVNYLEYIERGGARIPAFMGIPIRIVDAITSTEAVVS